MVGHLEGYWNCANQNGVIIAQELRAFAPTAQSVSPFKQWVDERGRGDVISIKRVVSMSPFGVFDQHKSVFVEKGGARGQLQRRKDK